MRLGAVANALVTERTPEAMQPENLFAAADRLGLEVIAIRATGWEEDGWADHIRGLMDRYGIGVELGFGDNYVANGDRQPTERFAAFVEKACKPLDVTTIGTTSPAHGGRFLKEPPLDYQLDQLTAALRRLAPVAEANAVRLAVENHADYRGYELASVLERVGSPNVGARLDTANPFAVIEEPMAAAEALAPYTVATHIKDLVVEAEPGNRGLTPGGLLGLRYCPLGQGHVDNLAIVSLLAEKGPLGNDLWLTMEVSAAFVEESADYARRVLAQFL